MKNNNFNLQILHHSEVFPTREEAMVYLSDYYKPNSLEAEPVMVKYGDERNPNAIFALGTSDAAPGSFYAIDMSSIEDRVESVEETVESDSSMVEELNALVSGIISSAGLELDENKIVDKVYYQPDSRDEVIGEAKTIAEAIDLLSKYVQQQFKDNSLSVEDTDSVDLTYESANDGGMKLSADVKISTEGEQDDLDFNNNIIGVKADGIYAATHLEYDDARNQLIFTTSGTKNGRFRDDAVVQRIDLGEHTKVLIDNTNKTVELTEVEGNGTVTLSGDVKISSAGDNILEKVDDKLFVDGRAENIKFQNTTVADKLVELAAEDENLENLVEEAKHYANIQGEETDTSEVIVESQSDGGAIVKNNVRLGSKNSIIVANGGLEANIDLEVEPTLNKIILKVGTQTKQIALPGVSIIDEITYDKTNKTLIITWKDGAQQTVIPVGDMLKTWIVDNDPTQPIVLSVDNSDIEQDKLSASLELRVSDNILGVENGKLFAPESTITTKVDAEKTRAEGVEAQLRTDVDKKIEEVEVEKHNDFTYFINVDGTKVGEIIIPETAYDAGDGLKVENKVFSIDKNNESEEYLQVSDEGIGIFGINDKFDTKADQTYAEALSDKIDIINGNEIGSFAKGDADTLDAAKAYTDEEVGTEREARVAKDAELEQLLAEKDAEITRLNDEVETLKEKLGDLATTPTISERLTRIETILEQLIDFDTYSYPES